MSVVYIQEVPKGYYKGYYNRRPILMSTCHFSTFRDTIIPYNNKLVNCLNGVFGNF